MSTRTDARGRRIPPPPARTFEPTDKGPERPPIPHAVNRDVRHGDGNISARIRRAGNPQTAAEWARLMTARPSAR